MPTARSISTAAARRGSAREFAVADQHIGNLSTHRADRIERRARVLKNHCDLAAAHLGKLAGALRQ